MAGKKKRWKKRLRRAVRYGLIRAAAAGLGVLPVGWASGLGALAGRAGWVVARGEREKALAGLAVAFPERRPAERVALGRACFAHLGRCALEMACLKQFDRGMERFVEWPAESRAVLQRALARGKGVLVVTGHVGHWELLARRVAQAGFPAHTIAKEASDPRLTGFIDRMRRSGGLNTIWRGSPGAGKEMLRVFKKGGVLGLLIDQDTKVQSVWVPFFGRPAKTPRAAADLAFRTGAAVVLGFCHRVGPVRFRMSMQEVALPAGRDEAAVVAFTAELTRGIEEAIRSAPEQWVWMHQRWRSQPGAEGD